MHRKRNTIIHVPRHGHMHRLLQHRHRHRRSGSIDLFGVGVGIDFLDVGVGVNIVGFDGHSNLGLTWAQLAWAYFTLVDLGLLSLRLLWRTWAYLGLVDLGVLGL
jgi:hypothetical protein